MAQEGSSAAVPSVPSVLFVCRANLCRSPMAEHLFRARPEFAGWTVGSAGIRARRGQPMHPLTQAVLHESDHDLDIDGWSSRPVTAALVRSSDLVLTASHAHLTHVLELEPAAVRRTMVLGSMARLLAHTDERAGAPGPAGLLQLVVGVRPRVDPAPPGADDLADPNGHDLNAFRACAAELERMFDVIAEHVAGSVSR